MSFASSYVFPGGTRDPIDERIINNLHPNSLN